MDKVKGCGGEGRLSEEVAIVDYSGGGTNGEMEDEEGNEEEEDGEQGVMVKMEGEIWVVKEGKIGNNDWNRWTSYTRRRRMNIREGKSLRKRKKKKKKGEENKGRSCNMSIIVLCSPQQRAI